jgi:hypothetical protein
MIARAARPTMTFPATAHSLSPAMELRRGAAAIATAASKIIAFLIILTNPFLFEFFSPLAL